MEKKQFKKEEPRGLELYTRGCKQEDCIYIRFFFEGEHNISSGSENNM